MKISAALVGLGALGIYFGRQVHQGFSANDPVVAVVGVLSLVLIGMTAAVFVVRRSY